MTREEELGKVAYETFRATFETGDLSWEELTQPSTGHSPKSGGDTQRRWIAVAAAVKKAAGQ